MGLNVTQLAKLWPRGPMWNLEKGSLLSRLCEGLGEEGERVRERARSLLTECDPAQARELEPEWMRATGSKSGKEAAGKLAAVGGSSVEAIKALARTLGFEVRVVEYLITRARARVGIRAYGLDFASSFAVEVLAGDGEIKALRATLEYVKPGHTTVRVVDKR